MGTVAGFISFIEVLRIRPGRNNGMIVEAVFTREDREPAGPIPSNRAGAAHTAPALQRAFGSRADPPEHALFKPHRFRRASGDSAYAARLSPGGLGAVDHDGVRGRLTPDGLLRVRRERMSRTFAVRRATHVASLRLAEAVRFELTNALRRCQFSRLVHSTALPHLRGRGL